MTRAYYTKLSSCTPFDYCPFCKPQNGEGKKMPRGSAIEMRNKFSFMQEGTRFENYAEPEEPANAEGDGPGLATSSGCTSFKSTPLQSRKKGSLREIPNLTNRTLIN